MTEEMLEVVDENDNVIGITSRKEIHQKGLPHREVHVLFINPKGDLIFQKRSLTKDTNPGLLTVTVGGHVGVGDTYEQAALREAREETGLELMASDLIPIEKKYIETLDRTTGNKHTSWRMIYGYMFQNDINELKVEKGESDGYLLFPANEIISMPEEKKKNFTASLVNPAIYGPVYQKLLTLVKHG